ncbi:MAG: acyltransferase [Oscillospiraceae bacterium]|nr:acyltransferase [Oscillospiraceae bacterium]
MGKKHLHYFDYLRLISAMGVIYMHVASDALVGEITLGWHGMNILTCFAFTAVPLFLMMSGHLLLNDEKTADVSYLLKKRLPRLVVPLIFWTLMAVFWRMHYIEGWSLSGLYHGMVSSIQSPAWVHLWYMYTLIALYLISPVLYGGLRSLDRKGHLLVITLLCLLNGKTILSVLLPDSLKPFAAVNVLDQLSFLQGCLGLFLSGYYLGRLKKRIPNLLLLGVGAAVLAVIIYGTYRYTLRDGQFNQTFQNQFSGFEVLLAACVFLFFKQNCNKECKLLRAIPIIPLALPIYLMHNILLGSLRRSIRIDSFRETVYVSALVFVICYLVLKTLATIKPLCYMVTGMKFSTACNSCNWIYTGKKLLAFFRRKKDPGTGSP